MNNIMEASTASGGTLTLWIYCATANNLQHISMQLSVMQEG